MAEDVTENVSNMQVIEVSINGPGRARRLFLVSGQLPVNLSVGASANQSQSNRKVIVAKIGPELTSEQFIRAEASASVSQWNYVVAPAMLDLSLEDVDADFDDESGRVAVKVEVSASIMAGPGAGPAAFVSMSVKRVTFTAQILATE